MWTLINWTIFSLFFLYKNSCPRRHYHTLTVQQGDTLGLRADGNDTSCLLGFFFPFFLVLFDDQSVMCMCVRVCESGVGCVCELSERMLCVTASCANGKTDVDASACCG